MRQQLPVGVSQQAPLVAYAAVCRLTRLRPIGIVGAVDGAERGQLRRGGLARRRSPLWPATAAARAVRMRASHSSNRSGRSAGSAQTCWPVDAAGSAASPPSHSSWGKQPLASHWLKRENVRDGASASRDAASRKPGVATTTVRSRTNGIGGASEHAAMRDGRGDGLIPGCELTSRLRAVPTRHPGQTRRSRRRHRRCGGSGRPATVR